MRKFLVIGCGSIGTRHIVNLLALGAGEIVAYDIRPDRRDAVRANHGIAVVDTLEEGWAANPDVAVIASDSNTHVELALQALRRGCHLFIEKPLSHSLDGVDRLVRTAAEAQRVVLVGCNLRFNPGLIHVKALIGAGAVGRVAAARAETGQYLPDWHPEQDYRTEYSASRERGGGVLLDSATHEIDYLRWMLGDVVRVSCFHGHLSHLRTDTEDTAAILLRFASGAIGEVHVDYVQRVFSRSLHVIGDEGTIRWDHDASEVRWYTAATQRWQRFENPPGWQRNQSFVDEMAHFVRCIAGEEQPAQDLVAAADLLAIALAAREGGDSAGIETHWQRDRRRASGG